MLSPYVWSGAASAPSARATPTFSVAMIGQFYGHPDSRSPGPLLGSPAVRTPLSKVGPIVRALRSSRRRMWWTSFVLLSSVSGLWALANPVFAGPDEPSHVIRAHALDHGDLTGRAAGGRVDEAFRPIRDSVRVVRAPEIYRGASGPPCCAHQQGIAACFRLDGSSDDTDVQTYAARQPPAYHAIVGAVSWLRPAGAGTVYLMRVLSLLMAGAFFATAITALRDLAAPALMAAGLVLAITPMVLFMSSSVNPNGLEIAASVAFWVCGIALISTSKVRVDKWLVTTTGIAACAVALSRELGPLWVGLVALAIVAVSSRGAWQSLTRSARARFWSVLVAACIIGQVVWDLIVRPHDASLAAHAPGSLSTLDSLERSVGSTLDWYREMIGWFGWLDTPAPVLTWLLWTAGIAFFVFVAIAWSRRRLVAVVLAVMAGTVLIPIIIEATPYRAAGTFWQGRYALPLAVGVPVLAAYALAATERGRDLVTPRFLLTVGIATGVAQFLAFAQHLRRYTVGYDGELQFWKRAEWLPPILPTLILTVGYAAAVAVFTAWVLWPTRSAYASAESRVDVSCSL